MDSQVGSHRQGVVMATESAQATDLMWQSLPPRGLTSWAMPRLLRVLRALTHQRAVNADVPRLMEGSEHPTLDSHTYGFSCALIHLKSPWLSECSSLLNPASIVSFCTLPVL